MGAVTPALGFVHDGKKMIIGFGKVPARFRKRMCQVKTEKPIYSISKSCYLTDYKIWNALNACLGWNARKCGTQRGDGCREGPAWN